jgi:hypothetical protein
LVFLYNNYRRLRQSLAQAGRKVTPGMAAGLTKRVWAVDVPSDDTVAMMDLAAARLG